MIARLLTIVFVLVGYGSTAFAQELAIANGARLRIVNTATNAVITDVTRYSDVTRLAYRPDGKTLAVGECGRNRVVELDGQSYAELGAPLSGSACPWDVTYAPDGKSLAATMPVRLNPLGALFGHLQIAGPQPLDVDLGRPLLAVAYRPGGGEIAVATPTGLTILGPGPTYSALLTLPVIARALEYTIDGSTLIAGTATGFVALDATQSYTTTLTDTSGAVQAVAVAQSGGWLALVRANTVSVRRSMDLMEVISLTSVAGFRAADFSRDGSLLAVAEPTNTVRLYRAPTWASASTISASGRIEAVAFRPQNVTQRLPVLFIHGGSNGAGPTWFDAGTGTSVAAALGANPQLPIDAFYIEMLLHNTPLAHGVQDDAADIQAMIEGGVDSRGRQQVGILNMPAYRKRGKVAIVGYSLGTITSRYYIKTLMGGGPPSGVNMVSEFVTLAAPNHGITLRYDAMFNLIACGVLNQPDRILRQLCGGRTATLFSNVLPCGCNSPMLFTTNVADDATFLEDLNGHSLGDSCRAQPDADSEAPRSRPTEPDGVLYVNLYASGNADTLVGGDTGSDCLGRRLARNLASDATNEQISGVPGANGGEVHENFPHHWDTICMALRTVVDHQAPALAQACTGLTHP
jgi:hypothetical protein